MRASFLLFVFALLQLPSVPPLPATVQGRVLDSVTLQPVARATIQLQGGRSIPHAGPYVLARDTAADGTFIFQNVPPGDYAIEVAHSGYITSFYGEMKNEFTPGTHTLNPGQSLSGIQVALTPAAVIYGRLVDDRGDVVVGGSVHALKTTYRDGSRQRIVVQSATSNDLGEYRLFMLPPGEYLVNVSERSLAGRQSNSWFFPGTVDSDEARPINLRPGETLGGVSFASVPTRGRRVAGSVQGASGNGTSVWLSSRNGDVKIERVANPDTGTFEFTGVFPGNYTLVARTIDLKAAMPLDVRNADILNASITLAPGFRIPVRVRIEGHRDAPDPDLEKLYFAIRRDPPVSGLESDVYSPFADGMLSFELPAGDYWIDISHPAPIREKEDMYVKSITLGEIDVLNQGLRVSNSSDVPMEILVGTNPGSVSGRTSGTNVTVVLIPDAARRGQRALYRSAQVGVSGAFASESSPRGLQGVCVAGGERRALA